MSDGPYRSLEMRPCWKKVAQFADEAAFASDDISGPTTAALREEWNSHITDELSIGIRGILGDKQTLLFQNQSAPDQIEALRPLTIGHGLSQVLLDCAYRQASNGSSGTDAVIRAVVQALAIWGSRIARQIEEHYFRKSTMQRANRVRTKIEQGINDSCNAQFARTLLKIGDSPSPRKSARKTGLDDGVPL